MKKTNGKKLIIIDCGPIHVKTCLTKKWIDENQALLIKEPITMQFNCESAWTKGKV